jgi:putative ABC transport system ATP-binding protein
MIQVKNLCKSYKKENAQTVKALDDISFQIHKGEFVAIVGPSGSGKTTLMNIIGLIDVPDSGSYKLGNKEVADLGIDELAELRNKEIGFVFQKFHLLPRMSAKENVELPLLYSDKKKITGLVENSLTLVGLEERMNHTTEELSGGQQQRVAIARALVNNPAIILADEPTGNLDSKSSEDIMNIFRELNSKERTIILITHDMNIASYAGRVLKIVDGKIIEQIIHKTGKEININ